MNADGSKQATSNDVIDGATKTKLFSPFSLAMLAGVDDAAIRGSITAAKSGVNADITSMTGLTTALSVGQGGTGVTTTAAQLSALQTAGAYGKTNILGTVSQTAGVPTGALMEYVTNGNGEAWKFACGLMICTRARSYSLVTADFVVYGGIWYYYGSWTFPVAFTSPPVLTGGARAAGRINALNGDPNTTTTIGYFSIIDYASPPNVSMVEKVVAVGRWF